MIKYGQLIKALRGYTKTPIHDAIPDSYYRAVVKTAIRKNKEEQHWDVQHVAAVLLHAAFNGGYAHPSQLTPEGLKALDWAETLIGNSNIFDTEQDNVTNINMNKKKA